MEGKYFKFIQIHDYKGNKNGTFEKIRLVHCNTLIVDGKEVKTGSVFYNSKGLDGVIVGIDHQTKGLIIEEANDNVALIENPQIYLRTCNITKVSVEINFIEDNEEIKKMNHYPKKIVSYERKLEEYAKKSIEKINKDFEIELEKATEEDKEISNPNKKLKSNN